MAGKRVYLETWGCQMNELDSELVLGQLRALGYQPTDDFRTADVVLLNTCSVRQHAEEKVYTRLGELGRVKQRRPEVIVGVIGCMAERDPQGLRHRAAYVDLLCGPGNLNQIPALIEEVAASRAPAVALEDAHSRRGPAAERTLLHDSIEALDLSRPASVGSSRQAYVRVQRGCDKFCAFCVVPFTRGPERSRPPGHIVEEARRLADAGAREITLLGQTVNSYSYRENGRIVGLPELLERVSGVGGLERIRFVTSYPGDFTDGILQAMRDLPKVCEYLHIPAQSGSNAVLKRMKRQYTVEQYLELIERARAIVPGIALAGDFIVGFCGETAAEHEATLALIERVGYKNIFMFKYSPRPGTGADRRLADDVPEDLKRQRHLELVALQGRMSLAHHRRTVGRTVEVLVEGYSKAALTAQRGNKLPRSQAEPASQRAGSSSSPAPTWKRADQLTGRTRGDEIVVFTGPAAMIGELVGVRIIGTTALTLHGEVEVPAPPCSPGAWTWAREGPGVGVAIPGSGR